MPIDPALFAPAASLALLIGLAIAALRPTAVVDYPCSVLAILAVCTIAAAATLVRVDPLGFTIDVDPASEPLIGRNDPGIPIYRDAVRDFGNDDLYMIAMEVESDVFARKPQDVWQRLLDRATGRVARSPSEQASPAAG